MSNEIRIEQNNTRERTFPRRGRGQGASWRAYEAQSRAYVFQSGETILESLVNRRSRPRTMYREILLEAHPELEGHIRWSQKAGCSCGCSPGFIIDHVIRGDKGRPADIYVTITADPLVVEQPVDTSYLDMVLA